MERETLRELALRGWNAVADAYAEELYDELDGKPYDREVLDRFAAAASTDLPVLDLGCGPGHVTAHLARLGLRMRGIDLAPEMIRVARARNPALDFEIGDILDLEPAPGSLGGAIAFYSLINLVRDDVPPLLARLARGLVPGAPLAIAVHGGEGEIRETEVLGMPVEMVATLFTADELSAYAVQAGLAVTSIDTRPPYPEEYPSDRVYLIAAVPADRA